MSRDWSRPEVEATVADYLDMLQLELLGKPYNKTAHRRELVRLLQNRSGGAIEFKHENISAVLTEMGLPSIDGYKPRRNYQQRLRDVLEERLPRVLPTIDRVAARVPSNPVGSVQRPDDVVVSAPRMTVGEPLVREPARELFEGKISYPERDALNRRLGRLGEAFVVWYERERLKAAERPDLATRVLWTSEERGDGYGYDVESFEPTGSPIFIEVKTTNLTIRQPFLITRNELRVSKEKEQDYRLHRVFQFSREPRLFVLRGNIEERCRLDPKIYEARFGS